MSWFVLVVAGLLETAWAIGLKYSEGFTRFWPSSITVVLLIVSLWLLSVAMKSLPVGAAYAIWVGIGAVGTVVLGIVLFGESAQPLKLLSLGLVVAGLVGLKLTA
ncbi:MAG: quaternary ammonium compound efflux SMR transporter SugE [Spongiibacteraceae bacterium]